METVEHDGRETAYRVVTGDSSGPSTLYVHGSGGSHQGWVNQYALSGPAHPAAALDLSGHGESEDVADPARTDILDAYARDVLSVAETVDVDVLVGNSMGGAVVLRVTLDADIDPAGIVLAGSGARLRVGEKLWTLLAEDFEGAIDLLHGEDVLFHDADERDLRRSRETMRAAGQDILRRDFRACHDFDVGDRLGEIDVPALAVVGEHDRLTPPTYHRELAEEMPACRYHELEDAAHLAMLDQPTAFNRTIEQFLVNVS